MALRLAEVEPRDYTYICTPTGNEPDEMKAHWEHLECLLGRSLVKLTSGTLESRMVLRSDAPRMAETLARQS